MKTLTVIAVLILWSSIAAGAESLTEKIDRQMKERVERAKEEASYPAETRKLVKEENDRVNKEQDDCIIRNGGVREPAGRPDKKCPPIVMPFADYLYYVRKTVTSNWAWAGKADEISGPVVVRFGITETGQVENLRITRSSGGASYDEISDTGSQEVCTVSSSGKISDAKTHG